MDRPDPIVCSECPAQVVPALFWGEGWRWRGAGVAPLCPRHPRSRPTHRIAHHWPDVLFCSVCGTPIAACQCVNPGTCAQCGEAAALVGEVCEGCYVPRGQGDPSEPL